MQSAREEKGTYGIAYARFGRKHYLGTAENANVSERCSTVILAELTDGSRRAIPGLLHSIDMPVCKNETLDAGVTMLQRAAPISRVYTDKRAAIVSAAKPKVGGSRA